MKRYVKEMISDFRKDYEKKCKENPKLLPAGFLREMRNAESAYANGMLTERDFVKAIILVWDALDEWISQNKGESAIKL